MPDDRDYALILPEGKRLMTLEEFDGLTGAAGTALEEMVALIVELSDSPAFQAKHSNQLQAVARLGRTIQKQWGDNRLERRAVLEALHHNQGAKPTLN